MRRFPDRRPNWLALSVGVAASIVAATTRGESFPFESQITVPGAAVHSGPGEGFYVTDSLAEGETVEVYRYRDNGWYAIRPPENSFSWVFASHVKLLDDSLAEIDKDNVPSRIGSRLSRRRNAVQVRLNKGEVVQIVGEDEERGQKWYKIAPPAGEFRWIHATAIGRAGPVPPLPDSNGSGLDNRQPPVPIASLSPDDSNRPIVTVSADGPPSPIPTAANPTVVAPAADEWRAAPVAPPLAPLAANDPQPPAPATPAATVTPPPTPSPAAAPPAAAPATSPSPPSSTPPPVAGTLDRQLTDIELRLSHMVAEAPTTWQIEPLRSQTEALLAQSQTVDQRDAVNTTLSKLERFAAIARRHQQAAVPSDTAALGTSGAAGYDAVGVLRPVVSKRPGAPQFALVDERGQVVSFVTAPPNVDLQRYVGQRVAVTGTRGFIPEFRRAHLTAGRVIPMDQRQLR